MRSQAQMRDVLTKAPRGFGRAPDRFRYDVLFLQEPLDAAEALSAISLREGVDTAHAGDGVIYFSRLISRVTGAFRARDGRRWTLSVRAAPGTVIA